MRSSQSPSRLVESTRGFKPRRCILPTTTRGRACCSTTRRSNRFLPTTKARSIRILRMMRRSSSPPSSILRRIASKLRVRPNKARGIKIKIILTITIRVDLGYPSRRTTETTSKGTDRAPVLQILPTTARASPSAPTWKRRGRR